MPFHQKQKCTLLYGPRRKEIQNQVIYEKVLVLNKTMSPQGWGILSHHLTTFLTL